MMVYKIRRKLDGLFWQPRTQKWVKDGHIYLKRGYAIAACQSFDAEIVTYYLSEVITPHMEDLPDGSEV